MKFSEKWLRTWVNPPLSSSQLAEQLTMAGFEVDALESCAPGFSGVIVARVEQITEHPDADRLRICEVDSGSGKATVVCGADNIKVGGCYALAMPGANLPDGTSIKPTSLKGVTSAGMLCSAFELGLSADSGQLFELHDDAPVGKDLADYLQLDDQVIDVSLTPNRGDCLSLAGLAREVAVLNRLSVSAPAVAATKVEIDERRQVSLSAASACPRYAGRVVNDIDMSRQSPDWLRERLRRADLRCVNIVVDLTNYVMLETGQPMHAFDKEGLSGGIDVRFSQPGEELTLLDGQQCQLRENTLVIADENGAVAMAGIMGGLDSAVSATTRHLFLESAYFTPEAIAGRAREYGLHTDASHRYERGVDFQLQEHALERLTQLILEHAGGRAGPLVLSEERGELPVRAPVKLEFNKISRLLGVDIAPERVKQILQQLELAVEEAGNGYEVSVPSFRFDISIEADLIEEVARIYGYDNMPSTPPLARLRMHGHTDDVLADFRQCLLNRAYHEIISYSFVDAQKQEKILGPVNALPLLNPISTELGVMRCSLLPGLIQTLAYNHNRQQERIRLFECGRVFNYKEKLQQDLKLAGIVYGNNLPKQWDKEDTLSDIYDLKGDLEALLQRGCGVRGLHYREVQHVALHPGQSAQIYIDNQAIGVIGSLHPLLLKEYDLQRAACVFELDLSLISVKEPIKFTKISKFPLVKRDISLLIDQQVTVDAVMNCIKSAAKGLLSNLELFDLYQGEGIDLEKKSLALGLTFQTSSSTLTEEEVESVMTSIVSALYSEFGATLRE